jgi:N-acetylmuramic acid 6-phosphate etherase
MIKLGRVKGNKMVDMQLSNNKLIERAIAMIQKERPIATEEAKLLLEQHGSVRKVILYLEKSER